MNREGGGALVGFSVNPEIAGWVSATDPYLTDDEFLAEDERLAEAERLAEDGIVAEDNRLTEGTTNF